MSISITNIVLNLIGSLVSFQVTTFNATLIINGMSPMTIMFSRVNTPPFRTATFSGSVGALIPGINNNITLLVPSNSIFINSGGRIQAINGDITLSNNGTATITTGSIPLVIDANGNYTLTGTVTPACLHANSVIVTSIGKSFIKDIKVGDKVLTGNGHYAEVKNVSECWIKYPGPSHDAVVFESFSLTQDLPNEKLIIDPGHPIKLNNEDDFRRAGEFVNEESIKSNKIYVKKWTDESIQSPTPSLRWDLVLEDGFDNYIANGIIVKSRKDELVPGYNHWYKYFM